MKYDNFPLPVPMRTDPRDMFTRYIVNSAVDMLEHAAIKRARALEADNPAEYLDTIRASIRRAFGPMPAGPKGGPLKTQLVSRFHLPDCTVENLLFDSFPGWKVNGTVFIPKGKGPFPAVVIPVGHSGKQFANYQISARAFASLGFIAITFDPPGQASEKQAGNDHFHDGVRCYLTGHAFNRYFVLDSLRCIDYLETRNDVYLDNGVGMSGVSGGGVTTLFASIFDKRIACQGPSCCITYAGDHPVGSRYAGCPEIMWYGRFPEGIDGPDIAAASLPTPLLYMAGVGDEIFDPEKTTRIVNGIRSFYKAVGFSDRFDFFQDNCGHAYTLKQVVQFSGWMAKWVLKKDETYKELDPADFPLLEREMLRCFPPERENTYTLTLAEARNKSRTGNPLSRLTSLIPKFEKVSMKYSLPLQMWTLDYRELLFTAEKKSAMGNSLILETPGSLLTPLKKYGKQKWVFMLSGNGRKSLLESGAPAVQISGMINRDAHIPHPNVVLPDLPGTGDTAGSLIPFTAAPWGGADRLWSYISNASGEGVMPLRTYCLVELIKKLREENGFDFKDVVLYGKGAAAVPVLFAAAVLPDIGGAVLDGGLSSFMSLLEAQDYVWSSSMFVPEILKYTDIPQIISELRSRGMDVKSINTVNGDGTSLSTESISAVSVLNSLLADST
ncbi:MAG: alpha/beta hydrolase family protein [Spirochaetia bacterium]